MAMREVSQAEFAAFMGPRDVHPRSVPGPWPWASCWETPDRRVLGRVEPASESGIYPLTYRYLLEDPSHGR